MTKVFDFNTFLGGYGQFDRIEFNVLANKLGEDGWELVNTFDTNGAGGQSRFVVAVFKRSVPAAVAAA